MIKYSRKSLQVLVQRLNKLIGNRDYNFKIELIDGMPNIELHTHVQPLYDDDPDNKVFEMVERRELRFHDGVEIDLVDLVPPIAAEMIHAHEGNNLPKINDLEFKENET